MGNSALIDPKSWLNPVPFLQFPLMSRSKKIHDLITNKESREAARGDTGGEPEEDAGEISEEEVEVVLEEDEEAAWRGKMRVTVKIDPPRYLYTR